jgi:hypothetical protein
MNIFLILFEDYHRDEKYSTVKKKIHCTEFKLLGYKNTSDGFSHNSFE